MAECPICYDTLPMVQCWSCGHGVCSTCASSLFRSNLVARCPSCRGSEPYRVVYSSGSRWLALADDGAALCGDNNAGTLSTASMSPELTRGWLGQAQPMWGVRYTEDGRFLYMALGMPTDEFFDLFSRMPRAAGGATLAHNRRGTVMRRTLVKEVMGFITCDDECNVQKFLRDAIFPLRECP